MLRRRGRKAGAARGRRVFLAARPAPARIAGYNPSLPGVRRAPNLQPLEVDGQALRLPAPLIGPAAFPPGTPVIVPPGVPPIFIPPVIVGPPPPPPVVPPCDETKEVCSPPPPVDVPEPGVLGLLILALLGAVAIFRRRGANAPGGL